MSGTANSAGLPGPPGHHNPLQPDGHSTIELSIQLHPQYAVNHPADTLNSHPSSDMPQNHASTTTPAFNYQAPSFQRPVSQTSADLKPIYQEVLDLKVIEPESADQASQCVDLPIKKLLPIEVRGMVYVHEVALAPGRQPPALLIALGSCKEWQDDYKEAQKLYRKHNYVVTKELQDEFKKMPRALLLPIRHLTIVVVDAPEHVLDGYLVSIKNAKAFCWNNLSTITVEATDHSVHTPSSRISPTTLNDYVMWLVVASVRGVDRIVVVSRAGRNQNEIMTWSRLNYWGSGKIKHNMDGSKIRIWEREDNLRLIPWKEAGGPSGGRDLDEGDKDSFRKMMKINTKDW
ncbi:hypothetical protein DL98DRAFT_609653 [Cadophora sp. DSE1049]|nr:hypothetical protein DL98DRAFT_609653 [Cadophora sp. DSE1049]